MLIDKKAVEIISEIDYDFTTITSNVNEVSQTGWIVRSLTIDRITRRFLQEHPKATVVNIGCGLDTTFDRIDNGSVYWYDLDLPDVIELRKKFIPENERRKFISCSFLDYKWLNELRIEDNILFIAAGVLYYFEEYQVKGFFNKIADSFPESEIVFDASSPIGIKAANKMVIKSSGMDENSFLKWGLKDVRTVQTWDKRIKILDEYLIFRNMKKGLKTGNKIAAFMSDILKMNYMVHIKFVKG